MKLKCIGGLADGTYMNVDNHIKDHDLVRVPVKIEFKIVNFEEELFAFREDKLPESMRVLYYYYKVSSVQFSKHEKLKFLIPEKWTAIEALQSKLG